MNKNCISCNKKTIDLDLYNYGKVSSFFNIDGKTDLVKYYKYNIIMFKYIQNTNIDRNSINKYLNNNDLKLSDLETNFNDIKFNINDVNKINLDSIGYYWGYLIDILNNDKISKENQANYNRWHDYTADSISIYDTESKKYINGWLGKMIQVKLKNNSSSFSPVAGVKLFIQSPKVDEITSEVAEIWLTRTYENNNLRKPFQSRLIISNYQFDIQIEYLGGYFISWIRNVNNTFSIEYDWIQRKVDNIDLNLFKWTPEQNDNLIYSYNVENISQFPNNDPTYLGKNLISCDYDFPYVGRPDWWRVDLWVLYPLLISLQTIIYGSIRLFAGDIVRKQIDDRLNGNDFAELFTICRNNDNTKPIYN